MHIGVYILHITLSAYQSASGAEVDAGAKVLSGAPDCAPLPDDLRIPSEACSLAPPAGASSSGV